MHEAAAIGTFHKVCLYLKVPK